MKQTLNDIASFTSIAAICCSAGFTVSMLLGLLGLLLKPEVSGRLFNAGWLWGIACIVLLVVALVCKVIARKVK